MFKILIRSLFENIFFLQSQEEVCDLLQAAPFQKVFPLPFLKETEKQESKLKRMENRYASLHVVSVMEKFGTPKVSFGDYFCDNFFLNFIHSK